MDYQIDDFIKHHNSIHKYYCEAIIRPNGEITYAEPSHLMKLQIMWGVPLQELFDGGPKRDELSNRIPPFASPVHWLAEVMNCVVLWYSAVIFPPNYTENQMTAVQKLMANGCIDKHPSLEVTMEYQICDEATQTAAQRTLIAEHKDELLQQIQSELNL